MLCVNCMVKRATKHLIRPLDLYMCIDCFLYFVRDYPEGEEIIVEDYYGPLAPGQGFIVPS